MNKERLLFLAAFLETVPKEKFDLSDWRSNNNGDGFYSLYVPDENLINGCGTTACAVGWACSLPEFNKQGLYYNSDGDITYTNLSFEDEWYGSFYEGWRAVRKFFDLDGEAADYLFNVSSYECPREEQLQHVIQRIREFCENEKI